MTAVVNSLTNFEEKLMFTSNNVIHVAGYISSQKKLVANNFLGGAGGGEYSWLFDY